MTNRNVACQFCAQPATYANLKICSGGICTGKWNEQQKQAQMKAGLDERVAAVRADKAVGRGTCSSIDECYDNTDLVEALDRESIATPRDAVKWAREVDGLHWESGLNQMSGEAMTDDPIREMHRESKERNALPIEC